MEQSAVINKSQNLTTTSTRSFTLSKSSYKINPKSNRTISDDFYTKKKVVSIQNLTKLKQISAKKIQNFLKLIKTKKTLKKLIKIQKRSQKSLYSHLYLLSNLSNKRLSQYFHLWSSPVKAKQSLTFDISLLKIKPELLEKLQKGKKGMISFMCDEMANETQTFIKDSNDSHTFFRVFNEKLEDFQVKEFGNFDDMNFSRFDFMDIDLPEFISNDFNHALWKKEKIKTRAEELEGKVFKMNENLLYELEVREDLQYENEILKNIIKKIIDIKKFN